MMNWIRKYSKWATMFIFGVALIAVYKTFDSFDTLISIVRTIVNAVSPFILAFVIAYMLNIPAKKINGLLRRRIKAGFVQKHSNALSIALVYVLFVIAIFVTLGALLPAIYENLLDMYGNLPQFAGSVTDFLNNLELFKKLGLNINSINILEMVTRVIDINSIGKYAAGVKSFTSGLFDVFIALIASIYMLIDKERILHGINRGIRLFSKSEKSKVFLEHCASINEIFTQYVYSRLICCFILAIVVTVELLILNDRYALLLGIFVGFMDIIPYFGSIISWFIALIVMIFSGGFAHGIWGAAIMLVIQQMDGNIIAPKIMGSRLEIRPLAVIIAVSVGGTLFGFVGMLISVPVVAILRAIVLELVKTREQALADGKEQVADEA